MLDKVVQRRLRWFGHEERRTVHRIPYNALHGRYGEKGNKGNLDFVRYTIFPMIGPIYDAGAENPSSVASYRARGLNKREVFSSFQFFNSADVREFAISCKVVT